VTTRRWTEGMDPGKDEPFDREPWRRLLGADRGAPTQGMDRRILAEARHALTPRVARWWLPASLAASLLLAVLIVQWQLADSGAPALVTESDVLSAPAPIAADEEAPAAAMELPAQRREVTVKPAANVAPPLIDMPILESRRAPATAAPAAPPATRASASPPQETERERELPATMKSTADAAAAAPAQKEPSRALDNFRAPSEPAAAPRSPEEWYTEIEALRAAGHIEEADAELARLEAAWPGWLALHQQDR